MISRKLCLKQVKNFTFLILLRLISLFVFFSKPLSIVHNLMVCTTQHITALLDCLKELCDEIPLKMWKEAINYIANTKEGSQGIRHWWTNMETIEADWNYGFWKLASQTVFQSSLVLFVTFKWWLGDIFVWQEAVIFSFTSNFSSSIQSEYRHVTGIVNKTNWTAAVTLQLL